ncbi:hypothetical protein BDZ89DRAFT_1139157 [Hymenopellis radicata]|nr:hypothetical protein BDZ89DRAFT_1139157 [Hymenopellis radicata]
MPAVSHVFVDTPATRSTTRNWLVCCLPLRRTILTWDPIIKYIKDQHSAYLRKELTVLHDRYIQDARITAVFTLERDAFKIKHLPVPLDTDEDDEEEIREQHDHRAQICPWPQEPMGVVNVEDPNHCELVDLRNFLTRTDLQDLIETTAQI